MANELSHEGSAGDEHLQIPFKSCKFACLSHGRSRIPARNEITYAARRILSSTRSAVDIVLGKTSVKKYSLTSFKLASTLPTQTGPQAE